MNWCCSWFTSRFKVSCILRAFSRSCNQRLLYMTYCSLPVGSVHSPLLSLMNKAFLLAQLLLTGWFLFFITTFSAFGCLIWTLYNSRALVKLDVPLPQSAEWMIARMSRCTGIPNDLLFTYIINNSKTFIFVRWFDAKSTQINCSVNNLPAVYDHVEVKAGNMLFQQRSQQWMFACAVKCEFKYVYIPIWKSKYLSLHSCLFSE